MNQPTPRARRSPKAGSKATDKSNRPATGGPIRSCVACARAFAVHKPKPPGSPTFEAQAVEGPLQVLRVCARRKLESPQVLVDADGRGLGRGAWICATRACVEKAWQRKSIQRALKGALWGEEEKQQLLQACVE